MHQLTIIKYADDTRLACYGHIDVHDRQVAQVTYTTVDDKEMEEIRQATYENVQRILANYI